ncbi:hypothetical protein ACIBG8_54475 [Nonomuraea sp. NPDC050556]|uniref:hypothetical protein n=1 Tax=Nonomuraea sp. NPDC050556 TaxID=3364369 RepID=UPI0037BDEE15
MIRIVVESQVSTLARPSERVELESDSEWDLSKAIDMCCRIDELIKSGRTAGSELG